MTPISARQAIRKQAKPGLAGGHAARCKPRYGHAHGARDHVNDMHYERSLPAPCSLSHGFYDVGVGVAVMLARGFLLRKSAIITTSARQPTTTPRKAATGTSKPAASRKILTEMRTRTTASACCIESR